VVLLESAALMTLAWFIVPGDRRWFVPASLVVCLVAASWPQLTLVRYQIGEHYLVVHRLTGRVDLMDARARDGWLHPTPLPGPPVRHFEHRPPSLAADSVVAATPARGADRQHAPRKALTTRASRILEALAC
jgi:hypothetical protein